MKVKTPPAKTIDEYIARFPPEVQQVLQQIRQTIRQAAPEAQETISYQMPTFTWNGDYLVYFGAYKQHIGFYPAPIGVEEFKADLARYASGQGSLKFPLDQPIPYELIEHIVKFRVRENMLRPAAKKKKLE